MAVNWALRGTNQSAMILLEVTVCMTVNSYEDSNSEQHGCINPSQPTRYALIHNRTVCGFEEVGTLYNYRKAVRCSSLLGYTAPSIPK
jgi:hypothetical protein